MVNQKHIINKQVLEVKLSSKKDAHLVQDAFSKAYRNHIIPAIERVFSRYTINGEVIRLDKLDIDVGGVSIEALNTDFPQKVERILEEILIAKFHERGVAIPDDSIDAAYYSSKKNEKSVQVKLEAENNLEILNHFLLTGSLPWWSSNDSGFNIQGVVEGLLEKSPIEVRVLLLKLLVNQSVRKRFIYQFNEKIIIKAIHVLASSSAALILEFVDTITDVQTLNPFISLSEVWFKEELWNLVLACIVENYNTLNANQLNEIEFTDQVLTNLIIHERTERTSSRDLFNFFSRISDSISISKQQVPDSIDLGSIIKKILMQYQDFRIPANPDEISQVEVFIYFLQTGKMPIDDGPFTDFSIHILAKDLFDKSPEKVKVLLIDHLQDITIRKRFIYQFSDRLIAKSLEIIAPAIANSIVRLFEIIRKDRPFIALLNLSQEKVREDLWNLVILYVINNYRLINENQSDGVESFYQIIFIYLIQISNGSISINEIRDSMELPKKADSSEGQSRIVNDSISPTERPLRIDRNDEVSEMNKRATSISETIREGDKEKSLLDKRATKSPVNLDNTHEERLYSQPEVESEHISNAGLVLLWPFLTMFFERLNLVKDKKFINEETSHRAVHLLQYLATEQVKTPEYELLFNKLLCGLDIYEPIPSFVTIKENEVEECNALLQSVIDNWTVLKNTSIYALRDTFLQKEGILSKQSNGWKLAIERTTVDILLDRLPWSISMIVLPWSNEMIYVEW